MILAALIIIPFIGGCIAWYGARMSSMLSRWISCGTMVVNLIISVALWAAYPSSQQGTWFVELNAAWIPQLGISFHLGVDGLSLLLVLLTNFLGIVAVIASWKEIQERIGLFHLTLLWVLAGLIGVFLSLDLFLFYFFWELMLVPMYFLIALWGHENRRYASLKFFIFTQASGLLMFISIIGLYFVHGKATGVYTFDYMQLLGTTMNPLVGMWLMLGFFIAFAVKLPVIPVHTWLPDAHTEAPTAGSVVLAGLLLKTGAYGLLRFVLPLFPDAAWSFSTIGMILGVIGILYGAILSFAQRDLKRLVAYTSISHMGFVILGVFSWNFLALQGAVVQILCHGLSTGALFVLVGAIQERIHTRDMAHMGGFWTIMPRMGAVALFLALASLGLPGIGNFIGEFLVLLGSYRVNPGLTIVASIGLIFSMIYALWMMHRVFYGTGRVQWNVPDLSRREMAIMGVVIILLLWIGLYPAPFTSTAQRSLQGLQNRPAHAEMMHGQSMSQDQRMGESAR